MINGIASYHIPGVQGPEGTGRPDTRKHREESGGQTRYAEKAISPFVRSATAAYAKNASAATPSAQPHVQAAPVTADSLPQSAVSNAFAANAANAVTLSATKSLPANPSLNPVSPPSLNPVSSPSLNPVSPLTLNPVSPPAGGLSAPAYTLLSSVLPDTASFSTPVQQSPTHSRMQKASAAYARMEGEKGVALWGTGLSLSV